MDLVLAGLLCAIGGVVAGLIGVVNFRDAFVIGILSPVGVLIGVVVANEVPERALRTGFALLAFYMAWRLLRRVFKKDPPAAPADPATELS